MNENRADLLSHGRGPCYHVIVNPARIRAGSEVIGPRSYASREAAESECNRLNGAAGDHAYMVIATSE